MARIGQDDWVATVDARAQPYAGLTGPARQSWDRVHPGLRLLGFAVVASIFPFLTDSDFVVRVAVNVLLFAILAIGLNVTVGWAGMLDLGFVAFYGFGAYAYAFLASDQHNIHLPTEVTIVVVVAATAALGLLLGLPSRRLLGDYLAIITLFFAQMFVEITNNLDRIEIGGERINITGGPNGIPGVDDFEIFGIQFNEISDYYYFLVITLILVVIGLYHVNQSRTGRAWRAIREDPLAAETMTVPVNRLKLLAFVFGAATAGLAGTVFAAVQSGVFPSNFEVILLVMIYAALVLGGTGSIPGAILGAIVVASIPAVLRPNSVDSASWLFYLGILAGLVLFVRPWRRLGVVLAGVIALGFTAKAIVDAVWSDELAESAVRDSNLSEGIFGWMVVLQEGETVGNLIFVVLVLAILAFIQVKGHWRTALLIPIIYMAVFLWENRLVAEPSVTRQLMFGAILVILMAGRPEGLLGTRRVEIT